MSAPEVNVANLQRDARSRNRVQGLFPTIGWYSVADYGAAPDGATDATLAIQEAIDACPAGGVVYVPSGLYLLNAPLLIAKAITFVGDGDGQTFFLVGGNIDAIQVNVGGSSPIYHLRLAHFSVGSTVDRTAGAAIHVANTQQYVIEHVLISNALGGRVWRGLQCDAASISGHYSRLRIYGCADNGVTFVQDGSDVVSVDHFFTSTVAIESNLGYGLAVLVNSTDTAKDVEGIYTDACSISGNGLGGVELSTASASSVIKNVFLRGTILDFNTTYGLRAHGSGPIQVIRVEDIWISHTTGAASAQLLFEAVVQDFVIDGGHLSLGDNTGIYLYGARNGRIQNVSIMSNARVTVGAYGILLLGSAQKVLIMGNRVYNNTEVYSGAYMNGVYNDASCSDMELLGNFLDTGAGTDRLTDAGTRTRLLANVIDSAVAAFPVSVKHEAAATPTGGISGEIRVGNGKLWVKDGATWKSVAVS